MTKPLSMRRVKRATTYPTELPSAHPPLDAGSKFAARTGFAAGAGAESGRIVSETTSANAERQGASTAQGGHSTSLPAGPKGGRA